jgi:membrane-associated phospholipid phosphatase
LRQRCGGKIGASDLNSLAMLTHRGLATFFVLTAVAGRLDAQRASDLEVGGAFVLGAVVLAPLDGRVHDLMARPALASNVLLHRSASTISTLILPGTAGLLLGTYLGGQLSHDRGLAEIGFHGGEAVFLGEVVTGILKVTVGRSRPTVSPDNPYDFHPGWAYADDKKQSFPSAHATAAFAMAAVLSAESSRWWRHSAWVGPVAYAGAGTAGLARVYLGKHWLSDVLAGAGIGLASGLVVAHFSESHPNNALDRAFLP